MKKYRRTVFDPMHDVWLLEERFLFFFWATKGIGKEKEVDTAVEKLNKKEDSDERNPK